MLHAGFGLKVRDAIDGDAGRDVKVLTQPGIERKPVFVVGFHPVDLAVAVGEIAHGADHLVVVFHRGDDIAVVDIFTKLPAQAVIRTVDDREHRGAVPLQAAAEHPVIFRKVRRNKNEIHKSIHLSQSVSL